jgi:uncharacterized protein YigE (DUF2233 family)
MRRRALLAIAFLAGLHGFAAAAAAPQRPETAAPCGPVTEEGSTYTVCTIDLDRYDIGLFWKGADGLPYGSFSRLASSPAGRNLVMAMNAGMYDVDLSPVGLYVEGGRELKRANTAGGHGNFHLKPNGVFYVAGDQAGVIETGRYLRARPRPAVATQSGPMLVIDGRLHPKFSDEGPSRKLRNGVGVRDGKTVVFAIADSPVSFGSFARLFRDRLGCRNALFLDGSVSSLYAPSLGRSDFGRPMGPILGATPKAASTQAPR